MKIKKEIFHILWLRCIRYPTIEKRKGEKMFQRVLNALRFGLVPDEYLKDITIDYKYYESCFQKIQESSNVSHFAMGPYGSGKSHFIRCVNHIAKENNFVTACIEIDSSGHISFAFPQRLYL
jgi:hypothetical protein